ncbi:DUF3301 domain-containing protein [Marinomonas ostreistagni]|uniref:DUF3301 domain-containing protein n=1 Tax=Marinomonas ostreistagni TaxID=359209 RepID=A0ABS0Z8Z7_9GAMM|nr:DUF3301 domain-containing protein [Marinomonas ostreistagni]MBJ7550127.1 DUF3301 domain-containing protein [Marinomonas ostreistagni]
MNISLFDIFLIFISLAVAYFVWLHLKVREHTLRCVRAQCKKLDLQLLDGAIHGIYWRPTYTHGQFKVIRHYNFYFTSTGEGRYQGKIEMLGMQQMSTYFDPHPL